MRSAAIACWRGWHWTAAPFLRSSRRLLHDLCDPFRQVAVLPYRYTVAASGDGFRINASLSQTPWRDLTTPVFLTAEIRDRRAVVAIDGETCGGRPIQVRLARYQPSGESA